MRLQLSSISEDKIQQLSLSQSTPPFYLSVEAFEIDQTINVTFYTIEIGFRNGEEVIMHTVTKRYSSLEKLDKAIKSSDLNTTQLSDFPKKRYFGNTDRTFIRRRVQKLQEYLSCVSKIPGILKFPYFQTFFEISIC